MRRPLTDRYRRFRRAAVLLLLVCAAAVAAALPGESRATAAFAGTTTQVTNKAGVQTDPSISGDLVVFTDNSTGNDDVHYIDLTNPGVDVAVASGAGGQRLHDVSGNIIVYTDQSAVPESVFKYDVSTAVSSLVSASNDGNPRLDGQLVAFERGPTGATDIIAIDLANPGIEIVVADTALIETNPAVSGSRVVYERRATASGPGDIVMFDTSTLTETVITSTPADERRPDIDGNFIVWDVAVAPGDTDIVIHDLSAPSTTVLAQPGNQRLAHVSGGVLAYDSENGGPANLDVHLRHIASGATAVVASSGVNDFLNAIDGNRVVYTSNADGDFDIYVYEFALLQPDIDVAPGSYDFGDVNVGSSATTVVTVSNVGQQPLVVSSIGLAPGAGAFSIAAAPALPATIAPGATVDVQVAFAPTASGPQSATLVIGSDDLDEGTVEVALSGRGVTSQPPPSQQIADLLSFFDTSAAAGTLVGSGPGNSAQNRLKALRNMIEAAGDLVRRGLVADACQQLADARDRTDGDPQPPDFVAGTAAAELRQRIEALRATLGCT
jgi:beta propeller repeat protein